MTNHSTNAQQKERPVIFTTDEVRAVLEGRKTLHRVLVEPSDEYGAVAFINCGNGWKAYHSEDGESALVDDGIEKPYLCPLGSIGDRLWVQEAYAVAYRADDLDNLNWCSAEHMTREASRLLLEITDVRPSPVRGSNDVIVNWVWVIDFKVVEGA